MYEVEGRQITKQEINDILLERIDAIEQQLYAHATLAMTGALLRIPVNTTFNVKGLAQLYVQYARHIEENAFIQSLDYLKNAILLDPEVKAQSPFLLPQPANRFGISDGRSAYLLTQQDFCILTMSQEKHHHMNAMLDTLRSMPIEELENTEAVVAPITIGGKEWNPYDRSGEGTPPGLLDRLYADIPFSKPFKE